MIIRPKEYLDKETGRPPVEMVHSVIQEHTHALPRLKKLMNYYNANSAIHSRQRAAGLPNNRIAHPYARYISTIATGYLIGQPVTYSADGSETLDQIIDIYRRGSMESVDVENARNASIYGKGVEFVHMEEAENAKDVFPHVSALSPENAFVVYDDTYDMRPLFGVYSIAKVNAIGADAGMHIWVMTGREILQYSAPSALSANFTLMEVKDHYFGGVPLIEYWNDDHEKGDFEWVLSLIDAYDKLESDRVNDKEQFVDKLLVLTGCALESDERGRPPWQQLREDKSLCLPDTQAKAEYLGAAMNEADVEIQRQALAEDIHKLSLVPDLSDKNFAQNASGVAMEYKLLGLEQLVHVKEQWFREGLRQRLTLFGHYMVVLGKPPLDIPAVKITFSRSLPTNKLEQAQIVQYASSAGAASTQTLVEMLHRNDDWTQEQIQRETARIEAERTSEEPVLQFGNSVLPGDTSAQLEEQAQQDESMPEREV